MNILKVSFKNKNDELLAGRLELPKNRQPHNFAIFAHCFTCNKNLNTVRNIEWALTNAGFGVLRFDFTGLGESDGDFENTNFSGNVDDMVAAAAYLKGSSTLKRKLPGSNIINRAFAGWRRSYICRSTNSICQGSCCYQLAQQSYTDYAPVEKQRPGNHQKR